MEQNCLSESDYLIPNKDLPASRTDTLAFNIFELLPLEKA